MFHVVALEAGRIVNIKSTHDETLAKMIAEDYENATYFDDEDNNTYEKLVKWLQLRGLSEDEAKAMIFRRFEEIMSRASQKYKKMGTLVINDNTTPIFADNLQDALSQVVERITGDKCGMRATPDLSGVIDRFGHRISREECGPCFACGEIAAMHENCMEPGGYKCCPSPMCEACGVAMAESDTAKRMAERYRIGPLNITATLSNLFRKTTGNGDAEEFAEWSAGILYGGPSLDVRLADPEYRPAMAALAEALRGRAEMIERLLREAGNKGGKEKEGLTGPIHRNKD